MRLLPLLVALPLSFANAQPQPDESGTEIEEIEDLEELDEVEEAATPEVGSVETLGRLHAALVHVPIGWVLLLLLFDLALFFLGRRELERASVYLLAGALLAFIPAIVSGLVRLSFYPPDPAILEEAFEHRNLMFSAFTMLLVAAGLRFFRRARFEGAARYAYLGFIVVAVALVLIGGHHGGKLVYGAAYLPF